MIKVVELVAVLVKVSGNKKWLQIMRALKNIPYFDQDFFLDNKKTLITGFKNIRCKRFSFYNCFLFEAICVDF
jgi:hypothetical protein